MIHRGDGRYRLSEVRHNEFRLTLSRPIDDEDRASTLDVRHLGKTVLLIEWTADKVLRTSFRPGDWEALASPIRSDAGAGWTGRGICWRDVMIFRTSSGVAFEIPDERWAFADMPGFKPTSDYYPYGQRDEEVQIVRLADIEPLRRNPGVSLFEKCRIVPVLFAFQSRFCELPPIALHPNGAGQFQYRIYNGCHRYYSSASRRFAPASISNAPAWVRALPC